jgi:hypothetical protein
MTTSIDAKTVRERLAASGEIAFLYVGEDGQLKPRGISEV